MDLPKMFSSPAAKKDLYYLVIYLSSDTVQAGLLHIADQVLEVTKVSRQLPYQGEENLIVQTDEALQLLGKESEDVSEVIWGFDPAWANGDGVSDAKKPLLQKVQKELNLQGVGFISVTEAVRSAVTKENTLASDIVVEITDHLMRVMLIQRGQFVGVEQVGRSGDIVADLTEALARFSQRLKADNFPPVISLVAAGRSEEELEEMRQAIIGFNWPEHQQFLHQPTVAFKPAGFIISAVAESGGYEIAKQKGMSQTTAAGFGFSAVEVEPETSGEDAPPAAEAPLPPDGDNFRVAGEDIEKVMLDEDEGAEDDTFGDDAPDLAVDVPAAAGVPSTPEISEPVMATPTKKPFALPGNWKKKAMPFVGLGVLGGILTLFVIAWGWMTFSSKVEIRADLAEKVINKQVDIILDPTATEQNAEKRILPAQSTSKTVTGTKSIATTGVTTVGEKATGRVTLINKTNAPKTFDEGTVVTNGSVSFTLDSSVEVASASVTTTTDGETKEYGKSDVDATANAIGADSNISSGTELTIRSFSVDTYAAVAASDFSGGNSQEVQTVAEDDRARLLEELKTELLAKAQTEFDQEAGSGEYIIPTGQFEIEDSTFSAASGDEVESLSLDLQALVPAVIYQGEDLRPFIQELLASDVPDGYQLVDEIPQILSAADEEQDDDDRVVLDANITTRAVPIVSTEDWISELAGLPLQQAASLLRGKQEVDGVEIRIIPGFAARFVGSIPKNTKRVTIVTTE